MTWLISTIIFALVLSTAILALKVRDLMTSVVTLTAFSFLMALLYAGLGAVDVSFNEAVIGAGVSGVFLILTIFLTTRRSVD
jgi:energy-converting hydrogenase B subunit D